MQRIMKTWTEFSKNIWTTQQESEKWWAEKFSLKPEALKTVELLKGKLTSPPVLELPRSDEQYKIYTDACDRKVGCVFTVTVRWA